MTAISRILTRRAPANQRGFSLAEMLVAVAVTGLLMAAILTIQQLGLTAYITGSHRVETQQSARFALDLLVRELRSAGSITGLGSDHDITFTGDCIGDGVNDGQTIRYHRSGSMLSRTCGATTAPLIGGVEQFEMKYCSTYNASADDCATDAITPSSTRTVRIRLGVRTQNAASGTDATRQTIVQSTVQIRNQY